MNFLTQLRHVAALLGVVACSAWSRQADEETAFKRPLMKVLDGFEILTAAAPPLVGYPMMACLDDRGRLYIAESDGRNLTSKTEIEKELPRFVRRLVDIDGDGIFDKSTIFADKMTMPEGGLWLNGALYVISPPYLWRLEDTNDDGVADKREKIIGYMEFDGRANQHGPYLGPNGRLYFSGGHFGYQFKGTDGSKTGTSRAAGIFSCRQDGSDVRIEGQGGINPVDIVFTRTGEMLSTCAIFDSYGGRHDALIHWLPGGLTQRVYGVPLVHETGYRLPAISRWGQVAPAGLMRYRGQHFGKSYKDTLFACQFNTHKLVHVRLKANGASFLTEEQDFLTSTSIDFHPADVLEDADGSLLLLDTGGWLSWGCPYSKIAKPQIKGAVYRIRRKGGPLATDPLGSKMNWRNMEVSRMVKLLADKRPKVRDRASDAMIAKGKKAVTALTKAFKVTTSPELRKRQLWVLSRINSGSAAATLRTALGDRDASVRQVAARSLGILEDKSCGPFLSSLLKDENPAVVRTAATALGQIGEKSAVSSLFETLNQDTELYLQHAITYALIEIGDAQVTASYLKKTENPHWQKTALRILEQMNTEKLVPSMVVPLLTSPHLKVRDEAQRVISSRREWRKEIHTVFSKLLETPKVDSGTAQMIESIVLSFAGDEDFQSLIGKTLSNNLAPVALKVKLLASIGFLDSLPESLTGYIKKALTSSSREIKGEALAVVLKFGPSEELSQSVKQLAGGNDELPQIRVAALEAIVKHGREVDARGFAFLADLIGNPKTAPLLGGQAARTLGHLRLNAENQQQAETLCDLLSQGAPLQASELLHPFVELGNSRREVASKWPDAELNALGVKLASALKMSSGKLTLQSSWKRALLNAFPSKLSQAHAALGISLNGNGKKNEDEELRLDALLTSLAKGNASRGRVLFQTNQATCSLCHRVLGQGGTLGPDLTKIGGIRSRRDLLEAIIFPNATMVNGYENYLIETVDGNAHLGLIQRQTPEALYLKNASQREERVDRGKIAKMQRAPLSVMPAGLEQVLSQNQLADLLAFLESCR